MLWAKTMTSKGKQFTAFARDKSVQLKVAWCCRRNLSAFSKKNFALLFCYLTNHFMTGPLGNSEFCFPRISMFPRIRLGKHWESRERKFTVPLGTTHYTTRYFVTPIQSNSASLDINIMSARTLYSWRARQWDKKIDGLKRKKMSFKFCLLLLDVMNIWFMLFSLWMSEGFLTLRSNRGQSRWPTKALPHELQAQTSFALLWQNRGETAIEPRSAHAWTSVFCSLESRSSSIFALEAANSGNVL